jgi:hypothetical protein
VKRTALPAASRSRRRSSASKVCGVQRSPKRMLKVARAWSGMTFEARLPTSIVVTRGSRRRSAPCPRPAARLERRDQPHEPGDRVVGEVGIGDVALPALRQQMAGERAAPPDLHHLPERLRVRRLAQDAVVEALAALMRPMQQFRGAVDGRAFLVARDQEADRAREIRRRVKEGERRGHHAGEPALHVDGAAPIKMAVLDEAAEGIVAPALRIARRHNVVCPAKSR